ncbi:phosphatase PAP2 family protein [Peribacillus alkalitolerans]|uniref:phosphatase PAP2 family protein n=1 Tax=Peribacillus alkalitolerans TaxID=1550385 RepID=UPI0013D7964A|nr:phosphatase PAP2 family protein [Peribacillus alkalitolerans]
MKLLNACYVLECRILHGLNRHFDQKHLNLFFRNITHAGGATYTIATVLTLIFLLPSELKMIAVSSALALISSHLPVHLAKKMYPRKRPYLIIEKTKFPSNPLQDHSFPSGHTTAIFSVIIPFIIYMPILSIVLLPLGFSVGLSRIYLGLHYPSDVLVGLIVGSLFGISCFYILT